MFLTYMEGRQQKNREEGYKQGHMEGIEEDIIISIIYQLYTI